MYRLVQLASFLFYGASHKSDSSIPPCIFGSFCLPDSFRTLPRAALDFLLYRSRFKFAKDLFAAIKVRTIHFLCQYTSIDSNIVAKVDNTPATMIEYCQQSRSKLALWHGTMILEPIAWAAK